MINASSFGSYHIPSSKWSSRILANKLTKGFFCAGSHDSIYAMGGTGCSSKRFIEIKVSSKVVKPLSSMITPKERGHAFWYHGKLYAFGGQYPAVIECYSPNVDRWCVVKDLKIPKHPAKVYVLGNILYLVGGEYGEKINKTSLEELQNFEAPKCPELDTFTACSMIFQV